MVMTGQQYEITAGAHWAGVSEVGANLRGYRVDTDPDVVAIGARVDGRYMTVVLDRKIVPEIRMEFVRRSPPRPASNQPRR